MFRSWIILGLFLSKGISVSGTTLTITPNQVQIGGANPTWLNGTCRPPTGTTSVFAMTIGRRRISSGTDSVMVQLQIGEEVKMPGGNFGSRLTAQGDIQSGSSSSSSTLRFGLSNPTCEDIRDYTFYCTATFLPQDPDNGQDFKNISYTGTETDMVQIVVGEEVKMPGGNFGSRLTAQGDIQSGSSSSSSTLRFGLSNPTCEDIRDYTFYCSANFLPGDPDNTHDIKNISYSTSPDNFKMIVFPDYSTYDPPTVVTFTCIALIGSDFPTDQSQFWRWQNRSVADNMATSWQDYPYTDNISYGNPIPSGCNYNGRSELRHTVTDQDDYQQFRCYIVNSNLYSGNKTVRITGDSTKGGTGQDGDSGVSTTPYLGPGLAIGFGVSLPVIVVLLVVIVVMYRRRNTTDKTPSTNDNQHEAANEDVDPAAPVDRSTYTVLDNTSRTQDYADLQSPAAPVDRSTYASLDNTARNQDYAELKVYANTEVSSRTYQNV